MVLVVGSVFSAQCQCLKEFFNHSAQDVTRALCVGIKNSDSNLVAPFAQQRQHNGTKAHGS
eukprot:4790457-Amphidinium_carterae.1